MKRTLRLCLLLATLPAAWSQSPAPRLQFEVASIKPAAPFSASAGGGGKTFVMRMGMSLTGNRLEYPNASLRDLIRTAYNIKDYQLTAPEWMSGAHFDVEARLPQGATAEQLPEMMQSLLEERFKLSAHRSTKDHDVYGLVPAKNGPKLIPAAENADAVAADMKGLPEESRKAMLDAMSKSGSEGKPMITMNRMSMGAGGTSQIKQRSTTLKQFAESLTRFADRPVIDMTNIEGKYDFVLDIPAEEMMRMVRGAMGGNVQIGGAAAGSNEQASDPTSGSVAESIGKYGLKLEKRRAAIENVVVDKAEKTPTEN